MKNRTFGRAGSFAVAAIVLSFLYVLGTPSGADEEEKPLRIDSRFAEHLYVVSASEKYRREGKNLFIIDVKATFSPKGKGAPPVQLSQKVEQCAFTADGSLCLCINYDEPRLVALDAEKAAESPDEAAAFDVALSAPPVQLAVMRKKPFAFVVTKEKSVIEVIDLTRKATCATVPLKVQAPVTAMALSPDDRYLVVVEKKVHLFEAEKLTDRTRSTECGAFTPRLGASSVLCDPDGAVLYESDLSRVVLSLVDIGKLLTDPRNAELSQGRTALLPQERIGNREKEGTPCNMALCPGTPYLFMTHPSIDRMSVVDTEKMKGGEALWGVSRVSTGHCPLQVCFTEGAEYAVVNNSLSGNLYFYDAPRCISEPADALVMKLAIARPSFMALRPRGTRNESP
ncbi:MAG: hypothetical protein RDV48_02665 [Candidatus Eremiobacteraeota bacterium]|nr:hypothetical protein [Candidatus Eremiobacteraeota bacterium]